MIAARQAPTCAKLDSPITRMLLSLREKPEHYGDGGERSHQKREPQNGLEGFDAGLVASGKGCGVVASGTGCGLATSDKGCASGHGCGLGGLAGALHTARLAGLRLPSPSRFHQPPPSDWNSA